MQAIKTVTVRRGKADANVGFEIFGAALGYKSSVKTVQGRHVAVRALVEMSVLEVIGRYLNLPYWRFLPDANPMQSSSKTLNRASARQTRREKR